MAHNDGTLNFDTKIDSSGFEKGLDSIGGVAQKELSATTNILKGATAGLTAFGGYAAKVGSDFEAGMSQVQAVSGASGEELEKLKEKAKEMGASTKFSATESAEALNYMAMAGWKTEEMLGGIEGIMNLAAASGEDLATTSDIVTDALTAFGMKAGDATHFADILAAASSNANTNVSMMGETFKYCAPIAGALGYSAEDTAEAIGLMANAGIKASNAGTAMRTMMTNLQGVVELTGDSFGQWVVETENADGTMRDLNDILDDCREAFANMTDAEKSANAEAIAGKVGMSGFLAVMNASPKDIEKLRGAIGNATYNVDEMSEALKRSGIQWEKYSDKAWMASGGMDGMLDEVIYNLAETEASAEELQEYLQFEYDMDADDAIKTIGIVKESLENSKGAAAEMAEIMQDNLQGQITILQSGLEGLGVSLYETMQGTAKDVVKEAQGMVQQLQDAFNEGGFDGLVGSVGDVLAQIVQRIAEAAPTVIDGAVNLVDSFCDGLKNAPGIGESGASLITSLVTGLMSSTGEIWSTAIVLVGKLAGGIAAGAPQMVQSASDALTDIIECIVDWGPDLLQAGADIIVALAEGFAGSLPTLIYQAAVIIEEIAMALVDNLPAFVDVALQIIEGLVQGFADGAPVLLDGAIQLFMAILEALPVIIEQLLQALPDITITITDYFTENTPMIVEGAVQMLMGIIEAIPKIIVAIAENLPEIINAITIGMIQAIPTIFTAAKDLLWQIIKAIPEIVTGLKNAVPDIIAGIVNGLIGGVSDVKNAALELGSSILGGIKSFFGINSPSTVMAEQGDYLVQGLINGIASMPAELAQYLDDTVERILAWGQQIYADVQNAVQSMVDIAVSMISLLPGEMWAWLVNTVTRVIAWGQQMLTSAKMAISNMISAIISQMMQLPGKVAGELAKVTSTMVQWGADIVSRMTEVGRNIVSGIWNGISSGWEWLTSKVAELANSLLDSAKGALGINSPSTEFRDEFGRWLMPGAMEGVKRSMPRALQDMKAQAGELLTVMKGTVDAAMGQVALNASGMAGARALTTAGTVVYNDNRMNQENNYHEKVITPAETAKNQREAFRKFAGGVK